MQGARSNNRCRFLTILDEVLTTDETAGKEERAGQPHPHLGDLEEAGRGQPFPKSSGCEMIAKRSA